MVHRILLGNLTNAEMFAELSRWPRSQITRILQREIRVE